MDKENSYQKRIYRQKPKSNRILYFIITPAAAAVIFFLIFFITRDNHTPVKGKTNGVSSTLTQTKTVDKTSDKGSKANGVSDENTDTGTGTEGRKESVTEQLKKLDINPQEESPDPGSKTPGSRKHREEQYNEVKDDAFSTLIAATKYLLARDYDQSLLLYKKLAKTDNRLLVYVGICYYKMEDYTNARNYLEEALKVQEDDIIVMEFLAYALYELDELEKSMKYAEAALKIAGNSDLQGFKSRVNSEIKAMKNYGDTQRVNFNIVFSKVEHSRIKSLVIRYLEDAYRVIGRQMDTYPSQPVTVILYNNRDFFDITRSPGWSGGLYDGKIRLPIRGIERDRSQLKRILFHEYTHALVHTITRSYRCPTWLNEGLAEFFSDDRDHGRSMYQFIPLKNLENGFPSDTRMALLAYQQSYSVVSYLIERYKLYRIKEFLQFIGEGKDINTAFLSSFNISYERFQETWGKR